MLQPGKSDLRDAPRTGSVSPFGAMGVSVVLWLGWHRSWLTPRHWQASVESPVTNDYPVLDVHRVGSPPR